MIQSIAAAVAVAAPARADAAKMKLIIESWRKFVNEEASGAKEISDAAARSYEDQEILIPPDEMQEALQAAVGQEQKVLHPFKALRPEAPGEPPLYKKYPEALMPMYVVEEGGSRVMIYKTSMPAAGESKPKYFKIAI